MDHKKVAKALIVDAEEKYLLLLRSDHPRLPNDPDLPGGTVEDDESTLDAMVREVKEEVNVDVDGGAAELLCSSMDYSSHGVEYALYLCTVGHQPEVTISWEHDSYKWVTKDEMVRIGHGAVDTYMHMVADALSSKE